MMVLGRIESGELKILNIQCKLCGKMYSVDTFNDTEICPICFKKLKEEQND
jgi:uncharacterized OB-fold protein